MVTTTTPPDARNALAEIKAWPLGSYAPGNYCCNCISCKREFTGDKRAIQCLDCAIIAHKARIAALEAQVEGMRVAEWQPIETAPKDGTHVLIAHASNGAVFSAWWEVDGAITDSNHPAWVDGGTNRYEEFTTYEPSHWQPLPAPPARAALQSSETTGEQP